MIKLGIAGSSFKLRKKDILLAKRLGKEICKHKEVHTFVCFDPDSLPMHAAKEIASESGSVTCFASDKKEKAAAEKMGLKTVNLNLPRLSREISFIKGIDALVVCGGGSGTLMEVTFAYQLGKRIFLLNGINGSVSPFRGMFLDERRRIRITPIDIEDLDSVLLTLQKQNAIDPNTNIKQVT